MKLFIFLGLSVFFSVSQQSALANPPSQTESDVGAGGSINPTWSKGEVKPSDYLFNLQLSNYNDNDKETVGSVRVGLKYRWADDKNAFGYGSSNSPALFLDAGGEARLDWHESPEHFRLLKIDGPGAIGFGWHKKYYDESKIDRYEDKPVEGAKPYATSKVDLLKLSGYLHRDAVLDTQAGGVELSSGMSGHRSTVLNGTLALDFCGALKMGVIAGDTNGFGHDGAVAVRGLAEACVGADFGRYGHVTVGERAEGFLTSPALFGELATDVRWTKRIDDDVEVGLGYTYSKNGASNNNETAIPVETRGDARHMVNGYLSL